MLAEVDYRVGTELLDHPPVGSEVVVRRREVGVVVDRDRILPEPPRRLDAHEDVSEREPRYDELSPSTYRSPGGFPQCSSTSLRSSSGSRANHSA